MFWESATQDTSSTPFCPTGAGHSCSTSAAGLLASWKSAVGSGEFPVELIGCNNLRNSKLILC